MTNQSNQKIFYSWQSDDRATNRHIEKALKKAVGAIKDSPDIERRPELDRDTQGVVGAVDISGTILNKIDVSDMFIADISIVGESASRKLANQNVLFELGYAVGKKGNDSVALLFNIDNGDDRDLPFDIRGKKRHNFSIKGDPKGSELAKDLQRIVEAHLKDLEDKRSRVTSPDLHEQLMVAIKDQQPTRSLSDKYFEELYAKYTRIAPADYKNSQTVKEYGQSVYEQYSETYTLSLEFAAIIELAAEYGDPRVLLSALKNMGEISKFYNPAHHSGSMYEVDKDYYALVLHELLSVIFGYAVQNDRFDSLGEMINTRIKTDGSKLSLPDDIYHWPQSAASYYNGMTGVNYVIPTTPIVESRFADNKSVLQAYIDGSLLLEMISDGYFHSFTLGALLVSNGSANYPEFIAKMKKISVAQQFIPIFKKTNLMELRQSIEDSMQRKVNDSFMALRYLTLEHLFRDANINSADDIGSITV